MSEMTLAQIRTDLERIFVYVRAEEKRCQQDFAGATHSLLVMHDDGDRDTLKINADWLANAIAALLRAERELSA